MDCREYSERVNEYLEGGLGAGERLALEEHLSRCPTCGRELALLRRTLAAVSDLPRQRAPKGFAGKVMERVGPGRARLGLPRRKLVVLVSVAAAAAVLIAAGVAVWWEPGEPARVGAPDRVAMKPPEGGPVSAEAVRSDISFASRGRGPADMGSAMKEGLEKGLRLEGTIANGAVGPAETGKLSLAGRPLARMAAAGVGGAPARAPGLEREGDRRSKDRYARDMIWAYDQVKDGRTGMAHRRVVLFRQVAQPEADEDRPSEDIHQVLDIRVQEPHRFVQRAVSAANRKGIWAAGLVFSLGQEDGDGAVEVELVLKVPVELYDALLIEMAGLTLPEQQSLSNTLAGRGRFFELSLGNYRTYQARRAGELGEAIERLSAFDDKAGRPAAPAAGVTVRESAAAPGAAKADEPVLKEAGRQCLREINLVVRVIREMPQEEPDGPAPPEETE